MLDPTWAVLWIALVAIPRAGPGVDDGAVVIVNELEVFDAPEVGAFATASLRKGDQVVVLGEEQDGWLAIEPPEGSFDWVDRASIEVDSKNELRGVIGVERTVLRAGRVEARMPGPPRASLVKGTKVVLLDQPPLILRQGTGRRAWLAIAPRLDDRRFVRAEGIRLPPSRKPRGTDEDDEFARPAPTPAPRRVDRLIVDREVPLPGIDARLVAVAPEVRESGIPAGLDSEMKGIEARHRRALKDPIDRWELEPIRVDYQTLLDRETDPAGQAALKDRLARVSRQMKAARSVSAVETLLEKSRDLDRALLAGKNRDVRVDSPRIEPFDADGILQASSRQVEGRRVWALISAEGDVCYLDMPPGLEFKGSLDQHVGVRGSVRYNDSLRARLIRVRDLELLGRARMLAR